MAPRRQLSLYVPGEAAAAIEAVRRVVDPVQHALIPAHVTLCRDDEVDSVSLLALAGTLAPVTLVFGRALAFDGHGVLLPCIAGEDAFAQLRGRILSAARRLPPHITLAHPRNPRVSGNTLKRALTLPAEITIVFTEVCLIEQALGEPWRVIDRYALGS